MRGDFQPKGFLLFGRPTGVSREQLRAFLSAAAIVLAYHGWTPSNTVCVKLRRRLPVANADGVYQRTERGAHYIFLFSDLGPEAMLTTVVHEWIHACRSFPEGTEEKIVSTLTARLKPDVHRVARVLLNGTYRRAAYLAHARLSYVTKNGDHYDRDQDRPIGVQPRYHR